MPKKEHVRIGRPPKPWLADLHVRIDPDVKRALALRAKQERKTRGELVEEAVRFLEDDHVGYPTPLQIAQSIHSQWSCGAPIPKSSRNV